MKTALLTGFLGLTLSLLTIQTPAQAYGKKETKIKKPMAAAEQAQDGAEQQMNEQMMAKWMAYATPNEHHQVLNSLIGNWDYSSKHWMSSDSAPEVSSGTAENTWIMNGRFLKQIFTGTWMEQPFEGIQITGYDNAGKEYITTWFDNMGTGMMISTGQYDPAAKILTQTGQFHCPLREGKISNRTVTTFIDENTYSVEMYSTDMNGEQFKGMEIIYRKISG